VLLDIPLLLETRSRGGSGALVDAVIVVYAPAETQVERQMARDGRSREAALERMNAQLPIDEKRAMADHVIDNTGSLEATETQVRALYETLTTR
jgi:dephospho-CoA kinase